MRPISGSCNNRINYCCFLNSTQNHYSILGFDTAPFAETGDLINFYNHIYVQVMKDVIASFTRKNRPVCTCGSVLFLFKC